MPVDQVLPVAGIETCPRNSCRETIQSSCLNLGETVDELIVFYKRWGLSCSNFSTEQARVGSLWDVTDIKWCSVQAHVAWWWRRNTFCFVLSPQIQWFSTLPTSPEKAWSKLFTGDSRFFSSVVRTEEFLQYTSTIGPGHSPKNQQVSFFPFLPSAHCLLPSVSQC